MTIRDTLLEIEAYVETAQSRANKIVDELEQVNQMIHELLYQQEVK